VSSFERWKAPCDAVRQLFFSVGYIFLSCGMIEERCLR